MKKPIVTYRNFRVKEGKYGWRVEVLCGSGYFPDSWVDLPFVTERQALYFYDKMTLLRPANPAPTDNLLRAV